MCCRHFEKLRMPLRCRNSHPLPRYNAKIPATRRPKNVPGSGNGGVYRTVCGLRSGTVRVTCLGCQSTANEKPVTFHTPRYFQSQRISCGVNNRIQKKSNACCRAESHEVAVMCVVLLFGFFLMFAERTQISPQIRTGSLVNKTTICHHRELSHRQIGGWRVYEGTLRQQLGWGGERVKSPLAGYLSDDDRMKSVMRSKFRGGRPLSRKEPTLEHRGWSLVYSFMRIRCATDHREQAQTNKSGCGRVLSCPLNRLCFCWWGLCRCCCCCGE